MKRGVRCRVSGVGKERARFRFPSSVFRSPRKAGLTLVEVILALMIIGTGLVALVSAVSRCLSVPRLAMNFDTARELLGQLEVEEPIFAEEEIEDAAGSGTFDAPHANFSWKRTVEQEGEEEEDGLWKVVTTITWTENQRARSEEVVTYIYRAKEP